MKIVVGGCRNFHDQEVVFRCLSDFLKEYPEEGEFIFLSGHCAGVDQLAEQFAVQNNHPCILFPAEWSKYGRAAGPIRNQKMVDEANYVLAFWDGSSRGTASLIRYAQQCGKPVRIIPIQ